MNIFRFLDIVKKFDEKGLHHTAEKLDTVGRKVLAQYNQKVMNQMGNLGQYYNTQMNNMATSYGNASPNVVTVYKYKDPKTGYIDHAATISQTEYDALPEDKKANFNPYITNIAQRGMTRSQYYNYFVPQSQQFNNYMGMLPYQRQQFQQDNPDYFKQWNTNPYGQLGGKNLNYNPYNTMNYWNQMAAPFVYYGNPNNGQPNWPTQMRWNVPRNFNQQQFNRDEQQSQNLQGQYSFNALNTSESFRNMIKALGLKEQYDSGANGFIYYNKSGKPVEKEKIFNYISRMKI